AVKNPHHYERRYEAAEMFAYTNNVKFTDVVTLKLKDPSWQVRETATLFLGKHSGKFDKPEVVKSLIPMLKDNHPRVQEAAALSLRDKVKSYPQLKKEFINILKTDSNPGIKYIVARPLGSLNMPEVKENIITFFIPKLKDSSWQVRESAVLSLGKFDKPEVVKSLIPLLKDDNLKVRHAVISSLGDKIKSYPELGKEFMYILKTETNPEIKYVIARSLQNVNTPEVKEVMPLIQKAAVEVKVVVIIPGVDDNLLGLDLFSSRKVEWSKDIQLRKILELAGIKVIEHRWTGNLIGKGFHDAKLELDSTMLKALKIAGEHDKVMVMMYSGGNLVGERFLSSDLDPLIKGAFKENRINLISLGSPSRQNFARLDANWKNIALDKDLIYRIFGLKQFKLNQHDLVYPSSRNITKEPIHPHSTFEDYRVISNIIHSVFSKLHMPQLDRMLKEQDLSKWKYFPTHGSWPGVYNFETVNPRPYVDYGAGNLRDPFVPQLPDIRQKQPTQMPTQQPMHIPQSIYKPDFRAPDNYYKQPIIMPQTPIMPPTPIIQPPMRR
ncbi:MAG: HEAT repeat domain-containing protein, partial [Candidatus Omnitrophota bacterium]